MFTKIILMEAVMGRVGKPRFGKFRAFYGQWTPSINNNAKVYKLILLTMYMYGSVYIRTCGVQFLDFDFIIYRESHNL